MFEDYAGALAIATEAALAAGELLRDEFHRASGPLGSGDGCEADRWAERLIREKLLGAFPEWGYRGEETGWRPAVDGDRHQWLVDPNSGTADFIRGMRGSSISIALLNDDRPVLGVVYAFAAPDDGGDLFTWAEGCGPLRRQGVAVAAHSWPARQGPHDIVLLSTDADRNPRANLTCIAPSRYSVTPSIAYRLALVAAGEAVAAVSLEDPVPWEYAGGHALLLGVGGELVGQDGVPLGYSQRGTSYSRFCFGGAPLLVAELARRSWGSVSGGPSLPHPPPELPFPVRLEPGHSVSDQRLLSRAQGSLLGQLCGDSLGSLVEFQSGASLRKRYPAGIRLMDDGGSWNIMAGQPTDDSEMALMLARSLVARGGYNRDQAAGAYWYWHRSGPFDEGNATAKALGAIRDERSAAAAASAAADRSTQANGCLMRVSPLGIFGHAMAADDLATIACQDASLTHPHPVCQEATAVFAVAVAGAVATGGSPEDVYGAAKRWATSRCKEAVVLRALDEAVAGAPADYQEHKGWVMVAFQNAFYQLLHAPTLEDGIVATVMAGGDTDTNAAIAGALLGAVHGYGALPDQWRRMVLSCRPVDKLAPTRHPRPYPFWPADALELAERLAAMAPRASS
jgi:ADP-ribosyl-[dinitrogen reductase] hydrolase